MSLANSPTADHDAAHGSLKSYAAGFVLSLLLTALSFGAVMGGAVPHALISIG